MINYASIGERIRVARKNKGLSQAALAQRVGISTSFMGHLERGTRIASLETIVALSEALGVSMDMLILGHQKLNVAEIRKLEKVKLVNNIMKHLLDEMDDAAQEATRS